MSWILPGDPLCYVILLGLPLLFKFEGLYCKVLSFPLLDFLLKPANDVLLWERTPCENLSNLFACLVALSTCFSSSTLAKLYYLGAYFSCKINYCGSGIDSSSKSFLSNAEFITDLALNSSGSEFKVLILTIPESISRYDSLCDSYSMIDSVLVYSEFYLCMPLFFLAELLVSLLRLILLKLLVL